MAKYRRLESGPILLPSMVSARNRVIRSKASFIDGVWVIARFFYGKRIIDIVVISC